MSKRRMSRARRQPRRARSREKEHKTPRRRTKDKPRTPCMFEGSSAEDCRHGEGSVSKTAECFNYYRTVAYGVWVTGTYDQSSDD